MSPVIEDRLPVLDTIHLQKGSHTSFEDGVCAMEMVAYLAGEPHSDALACACPVLTRFVVTWNDGLPSDADRDRLLKPFLPRLIGTRSTTVVEQRRAWLAMDWLIREFTPTWLDRVDGLRPHAAALRALDVVQDLATLEAATPSLRSAADAAARAAAWEADRAADWEGARAAARAAAWEGAWAAAWEAAWEADREAAWEGAWAADREAAWEAAWAAAWAAALEGARAADREAAREALAPTVLALQTSAAALLDRMLEVTDADAVAR